MVAHGSTCYPEEAPMRLIAQIAGLLALLMIVVGASDGCGEQQAAPPAPRVQPPPAPKKPASLPPSPAEAWVSDAALWGLSVVDKLERLGIVLSAYGDIAVSFRHEDRDQREEALGQIYGALNGLRGCRSSLAKAAGKPDRSELGVAEQREPCDPGGNRERVEDAGTRTRPAGVLTPAMYFPVRGHTGHAWSCERPAFPASAGLAAAWPDTPGATERGVYPSGPG